MPEHNSDRLDIFPNDERPVTTKVIMMSKLTLHTEGDTHVIVRRRFVAPPEVVYRAHTDTDLLRRWLLGPDGWTMPVCINEPRPGGRIRYEWADGQGGGLQLTGEFVALEPGRRIVHVERMHMPDPTPDNHVETTFEVDGDGTLMTMRMTSPDPATRAAMLATGIEEGIEASYIRLEDALSESPDKALLDAGGAINDPSGTARAC